MLPIWDYDIEELKKTEQGRILILERMINYGVSYKNGPKIKLSEVKKNWSQLHLFDTPKRFFEFLLWNKISSPQSKKSFLTS